MLRHRIPWQKPLRGTLLNRSHPLARGLWACFPCNEIEGTPFDACHRLTATMGSGNIGRAPLWEAGSVCGVVCM